MRRFNAYELNILSKHNVDPTSIIDLNIPVEYIVGEVEFCEHLFQVNKSTLIPRVETEYLIEIALKQIQTRYINYADIGCGSGAIGLSFGIELAKRNTMFSCFLSDNSDEALKVASANYENLKTSLKENKILIFNSNLLKSYDSNNKLEIIFANLPYIPTARISQLDTSVREYEPITALDGGVDGLQLIRELLQNAGEYLSDTGCIILEVDDSHKDPSEFNDKWSIEVKNDFNGKVRYWVCKAK